jgi:hypothetical protein
MFLKKKIKIKTETNFDGIVTFFNSFNAMKAEKTANKGNINCKLVHSPRELSPTCGVALAYKFCESNTLKLLLQDERVSYDGMHEYSQ